MLLTGLAGYWLKPPSNENNLQRIAGGGPLRNVAGVKILESREAAIINFQVVKNNIYTAGLPSSFKPETIPFYEINDSNNWRGAGAFLLAEDSGKTLIKVNIQQPGVGKTIEGTFLSLNFFGKGKCLRLGCRLAPFILDKQESHILKMLNNILVGPALK